MTPLVVWGAGCKKAAAGGGGGRVAESQKFASFPVLKNKNVPEVRCLLLPPLLLLFFLLLLLLGQARQVDLAPLLSTLLGVATPKHSCGRLVCIYYYYDCYS